MNAAKLVVLSGAGLSAESGLATFRDCNGLWAQYDPMTICNFHNWEHNFDLVHHFYNLRRAELEHVKPNAMHAYLASLEHQFPHVDIIHLTQNVDDLLERAGASAIIHLHGELTKIACLRCGAVYPIAYSVFDKSPCKHCANPKLKPKIVFFYENAPEYQRLHDILYSLSKNDCLLVIGTSGTVIDISSMLAFMQSCGIEIGRKILNNLEYSPNIDEQLFDEIIYMPATQAISKLDTSLNDFFRGNT